MKPLVRPASDHITWWGSWGSVCGGGIYSKPTIFWGGAHVPLGPTLCLICVTTGCRHLADTEKESEAA